MSSRALVFLWDCTKQQRRLAGLNLPSDKSERRRSVRRWNITFITVSETRKGLCVLRSKILSARRWKKTSRNHARFRINTNILHQGADCGEQCAFLKCRVLRGLKLLMATVVLAAQCFGMENPDAQPPQTCYSIVELRQYTLHPGQRDALIDLFDREFVESQEALGIKVIGQFRDLDNPNRFVWLRGFRGMPSRAQPLKDFYGGPGWQAHQEPAH